MSHEFIIGYIGPVKFFTYQALDHLNGRLSNEKLLAMSDSELIKQAYNSYPHDIVYELYEYPNDVALANALGFEPGKVHRAAHRAWFILEFRRQQRHQIS